MGNTPIIIGNQTLLIEREIGSGGFAKLYLAHPQNNPSQTYALKAQPYFDQTRLEQIKKEITIHKRCCQNAFVANLYISAAFSNPRKEVLMLMEYCPNTLVEILQKGYPNPLPESATLGIFYQLANAICYLHSLTPPIVHRDIKVENVLFSEDRKFKLIDFGSAIEENALIRRQGDCAIVEEEISKMTTMAYRAPEMISLYQYMPIGCKSDVWALGCLIYKCLMLETPFEESPMKICGAKYVMPNCTSFMQKLFSMIFIVNPDDRADIFQVLGEITDATKLQNPFYSKRRPFTIKSEVNSSNIVQPNQGIQNTQVTQSPRIPLKVSGTREGAQIEEKKQNMEPQKTPQQVEREKDTPKEMTGEVTVKPTPQKHKKYKNYRVGAVQQKDIDTQQKKETQKEKTAEFEQFDFNQNPSSVKTPLKIEHESFDFSSTAFDKTQDTNKTETFDFQADGRTLPTSKITQSNEHFTFGETQFVGDDKFGKFDFNTDIQSTPPPAYLSTQGGEFNFNTSQRVPSKFSF
ncbi:actin-regulating kinase, putative [Entamoeba invadens IP1]|uniref:non-specific serine/threonine protein kinase n=1 Tax=Entamoeba invadens IP1 TaxID=370355 RepID=A0A0A1UHE4_ENTIV|nr:actin-regulating kinase, putative [Entamoeba invadens IP1]ELP95177.1 actin-regulating kinase, putative [Entamoeba invadens IP1]|eukprot:XP_004261948.1 actin-regulating kinase, putative [Entamoeba invadens IP1]